jgi:acyloxyacyl hydrolase
MLTGTGHVNLKNCPPQLPVAGASDTVTTSLYSLLQQRNRCNNNDFQNIGVNGARMTSSNTLVNALARNPQHDDPLLLWIPLIGNDVCSGHHDYDHMTTVDEMYTATVATLRNLDMQLPPNSYVVSVGLVEGDLLYSTMSQLQHPIGATYENVYDFLNCMQENPCWGWLNSNATIRAFTSQRAKDLSNVYLNISSTLTFNNFKYIAYLPDWKGLFQEFVNSGQPANALIEKADGFHPAQTGNAAFAVSFFAWLSQNYPDAVGDINPHNAEIDALFPNVVPSVQSLKRK